MNLIDREALREQVAAIPTERIVDPLTNTLEHDHIERNIVLDILDAAEPVRCERCEHWDTEDVQVVASVAFSSCKNRMVTKEFKTSVTSGGWLCPCFTRREAT